jgi:hypothetical protein
MRAWTGSLTRFLPAGNLRRDPGRAAGNEVTADSAAVIGTLSPSMLGKLAGHPGVPYRRVAQVPRRRSDRRLGARSLC